MPVKLLPLPETASKMCFVYSRLAVSPTMSLPKAFRKRLKEKYPHLNLLFLDADAGVSEVNFFNRMHFFVNHAKTAHTQAKALL